MLYFIRIDKLFKLFLIIVESKRICIVFYLVYREEINKIIVR